MTHPSSPTPALDRTPLEALLWADSVAVVGASPKHPSVGNRVMTELLGGGFRGRVIPVNPSHAEVEGLATIPSLADLDTPVDLAIVAVADHRLEEQFILAIATGVGAITVFSPAQGEATDGTPLRKRLAQLAEEAGIAVCGPNGMGFVNVEHSLRATGFYQPATLEPGGIAFLSHSGSLFSAMLHNQRRMRFNLVISTGQEIVTTMDAYLEHAVSLPSTRVVGLFLETVRRPAEMARALDVAAAIDVPVVALKVGRTDHARAAAATHSGALAGEDAAYDAFFRAHRVHRVDSMDEMADTLEIFAAGRRARPGGLGAVHDSGGERTLLIDTAHQLGVPLAVISEQSKRQLAAVLEPGLEPENPVDAWGTGHGSEGIFEESIRTLAADPAVGAVAFCVDLTSEEHPAEGYLGVVDRIVDLDVPLAVLTNLRSGIDPAQADHLRSRGVPVLEGTRPGLVALGHLLDRARPRANSLPPAGPDAAVVDRWRRRLETGEPVTEAEALSLVADFGIPVIRSEPADNLAGVVKAAEAVGYPVALKTAHADHKTDVAGVRLDLSDLAAAEAAYEDLSGRLGPEVIVQAMATGGVEIALGLVRDDQFGPLVMVAAGGTLVELLADRSLAVPPFGTDVAGELIERLSVAPVLAGARGRPPADLIALASAVARLSVVAADLGDLIAGLDINPVIVSEIGAVAVDALVVPA